ncbi:hypothetical protein AAVH_17243 [Aphelenchoides avenae]|nr:hypothetical protein AAVH_17243 [Aphelenchus avenae]
MENADYERIDIDTLDLFDAVRDVKVLLQKSYVRRFELCAHSRQEIVTKRQWSALVSAVQSATIQMIDLKWLDLTDVEADQVKRIINVSCLEEVVLKWCRVRSASISDAFLSLCRDNGVTRLMINDNDVVDGPSLAVTEKAIFDYCFRTDVRHGTNKLRLSIGHVSNSFLRRLIKS